MLEALSMAGWCHFANSLSVEGIREENYRPLGLVESIIQPDPSGSASL